jgi:hypothetical protein
MGINNQLQQRLDAYVAGDCSPRALSDELLAHCAATPRAIWEILALLDQYHRRGKLPQELHRSISQSLERRALGVQGLGADRQLAAANQADMERPLARRVPVAPVVEPAAPTAEVLQLREELQATRALAAGYQRQLNSRAWRRRAVPLAGVAVLVLAITASVGVRAPVPAPPVRQRAPPVPVLAPVTVPTPGQLSLASDTIIVQPGEHTAAITVTRSGGTDGTISFLWWTQNAGARAGRDFRAHLARRVSMPAGTQTVQLSVPILDNPARRHTELFYVTIGRPRGGAALGGLRRAAVFIVRG